LASLRCWLASRQAVAPIVECCATLSVTGPERATRLRLLDTWRLRKALRGVATLLRARRSPLGIVAGNDAQAWTLRARRIIRGLDLGGVRFRAGRANLATGRALTPVEASRLTPIRSRETRGWQLTGTQLRTPDRCRIRQRTRRLRASIRRCRSLGSRVAVAHQPASRVALCSVGTAPHAILRAQTIRTAALVGRSATSVRTHRRSSRRHLRARRQQPHA
jgi:hypothetical protein